MLSLILSYILKPLTQVGAMLLAVFSVFTLGRRDAAKEAALEALKEAQRANEIANAARRDSDIRSSSGGLRDNDGYRRD